MGASSDRGVLLDQPNYPDSRTGELVMILGNRVRWSSGWQFIVLHTSQSIERSKMAKTLDIDISHLGEDGNTWNIRKLQTSRGQWWSVKAPIEAGEVAELWQWGMGQSWIKAIKVRQGNLRARAWWTHLICGSKGIARSKVPTTRSLIGHSSAQARSCCNAVRRRFGPGPDGLASAQCASKTAS